MSDKRKEYQAGLTFSYIPLKDIQIENNIRKEYKEEDIDMLAESIKKVGILQ